MRERHWRQRMRRAALLSGTLMILSGCATTTDGGGTEVFCRAAVPLRWSASDTEETIRQAKAHNAVGRALCHWR